jgi:DNA-binding MarR family transcriptional regulator
MSLKYATNNINKARYAILNMRWLRLIVFCDVIDRYLHQTLKEYNDWLKVDALLFMINREENITPSDLAKLMLRSRNSITNLINGLENEGFIKRVNSKKDHRIIFVKVTSKGLRFTMSNLSKLTLLDGVIEDCLDDDEFSDLVRLTRKFRTKLIEKATGLKPRHESWHKNI